MKKTKSNLIILIFLLTPLSGVVGCGLWTTPPTPQPIVIEFKPEITNNNTVNPNIQVNPTIDIPINNTNDNKNDLLNGYAEGLKNGKFNLVDENEIPLRETEFDIIAFDPEGLEIPLIAGAETDASGSYALSSTDISRLENLKNNSSIKKIGIQAKINGKKSKPKSATLRKNSDGFVVEARMTDVDLPRINIIQENYNIFQATRVEGVEVILKDGSKSSNVRYTSSDNTVVSVSSDGMMTPRKSGSSVITVSAAGNIALQKKINVTVDLSCHIADVVIDKEHISKTVKKGANLQLFAEAKCQNGKTENSRVTWYSSDSSIASVDISRGLVISKKAGQVTITAKTDEDNYDQVVLDIKE